MNLENQELQVNTSARRLELPVADSTAFIEYRISHHSMFLTHTEVPPALEGQGVGTALVEKALQYAQDNRYTIVPLCAFVQAYLKRHPQWNHLVDPNADRLMDQ